MPSMSIGKTQWGDASIALERGEVHNPDDPAIPAISLCSLRAGGGYADDGDRIFVNVDYRERGYALAYKNGVYGYVDAGYIDW